jgi:hypothetical protein
MSGLDPGRIVVAFTLVDGAVGHASVRSERPLSLAARFAGQPVGRAIEAVGLLHAVCGVSHAAALTLAAAAAVGRIVPAEEVARWQARLAAERIAEHLRDLAHLAPVAAFPVVRDALDAAHSATRSGVVGDGAEAIGAALALAPSWLPAMAGDAAPPDMLTAADDDAVITALAADAGFAALPALSGRHPETGPAPRAGRSAGLPGATLAARLAEAEAALDWLRARPGEGRDFAVPLIANRTQMNTGYASVESPRGRLYYFAVVQGDGRLRDARVVAPTEWNFHPEGPFARALAGFRPDGDAVTAIARLAAQFSPCVAVDVVPEGAARA